MKKYNTLPEEQEAVINIDYFSRVLHIYSSKKSVIQRLTLRLGKATKTYYIKKSMTGAKWEIPFADKKRINISLSRPLLIGQMK